MIDLLCALANSTIPTLLPRGRAARAALESLRPRPVVVEREGGVAWLIPTPSLCCLEDGRAFVHASGTLRLATPEDLEAIADACGLGTFESAELRAPPPDPWLGSPVAFAAERVPRDANLGAVQVAVGYQRGTQAESRVRPEPDAACRIRPAHAATVRHLASEIAAHLGHNAAAVEALVRGLLVNAVVHRSYAPAYWNIPIAITVYADGVSVRSPGGIPRQALDPNGVAPVRAFSRNPKLANVFVAAGLARRRGEGLLAGAPRAVELGYRVEVDSSGTEVTATLRSLPETWYPSRPQRSRDSPEARALAVLAHLSGGQPMSARSLADATGMPPSTLRITLTDLVEQGLITPTEVAARSRNQRYVLADAGAVRSRGPADGGE